MVFSAIAEPKKRVLIRGIHNIIKFTGVGEWQYIKKDGERVPPPTQTRYPNLIPMDDDEETPPF